MKRYVCNNLQHPVQKHPKEYDEITQDGFCPDCPYGEGILLETEWDPQRPETEQDGQQPVIDELGLCVLVCDASFSMSEPAFRDGRVTKMEMVLRSAANGIVDNYQVSYPEKALIALIGFGGKVTLLRDPQGLPFIKSLADIQKEFPTAQHLADFIRAQLAPNGEEPLTDTIDRNYTDISGALTLAHQMVECALKGDLSPFGFANRFTLLEHHSTRKRDSHQYNRIPNVRVLIYSDGKHYPSSGVALANPFTEDLDKDQISVLMTGYFGDGGDAGADQMKSSACTCPIHETKGYFLINNSERYQTLRKLFRMASGTTGFCPICLREAISGWEGQGKEA